MTRPGIIFVAPHPKAYFHRGTWKRKYVQLYFYIGGDLTSPVYYDMFLNLENLLLSHAPTIMEPAWGTLDGDISLIRPSHRRLIRISGDDDDAVTRYFESYQQLTETPSLAPIRVDRDEMEVLDIYAWRIRTVTYRGPFYRRTSLDSGCSII